MASISHGASAEEIEDELMLQQALLDSIGEDGDPDDEQRQQIQSAIDSLEARLHSLNTSTLASNAPSPVDSSATLISDTDESLSAGSKRPGEALGGNSRAKRPALDQHRSPSVSFESAFSHPTSSAGASAAAKARERQKLAEEAALRRYNLQTVSYTHLTLPTKRIV